jgi:hypothetical protein
VGTLASFITVGLLYDYGLYQSFFVSFGVGAVVSGLALIGLHYWKK